MIEKKKFIVACNGIKLKLRETGAKYVELNHNKNDKINYNVRIELQNFVTGIYNLNDRKRDLLELAGYIFATDRKCPRGINEEIVMDNWSREIEIHIKVRDLAFWNNQSVKDKLEEALTFMTGDYGYKFVFYQHDGEEKYDLFDDDKFIVKPTKRTNIVLFSGGLDSLAGIIELLETTNNDLWLVSHQSGNPSVAQIQNNLFNDLNNIYPNRCYHYKYKCGLAGRQRADETQRTRSFLFNSIAYSLASTYGIDNNVLFENAITSFNFGETQDMINGRASRTTHPKVLHLLMSLFSEIEEKEYKISNGFVSKTKTDVVSVLKEYDKLGLMDTAVSCSTTRYHRNSKTHCGICSQCIDRRFAAYSAEVEKYDENGLYDFNFIKEDLDDREKKKALSDYLNQAKIFYENNLDGFNDKYLEEIIDIEEYLNGSCEEDRVSSIYEVCSKHGEQVQKAIGRMSEKHDKAFTKFRANSFFSLILGMRSKADIIELLKITPDGETKKEMPKRRLKEIASKVYEKQLNNGKIDIKAEETKKDKKISKVIVEELEKEYIVKPSQKTTISDYFRKRIIEAKRKNGKYEVVRHKN